LRTYRARRWEIEVDGTDLSGRYLLWHVMNIRSVGPVLTLATEAKTNDGNFDFIGAREEDRALLLDHFGACAAGKRRKFALRAKRFTEMRLRWKKWLLHFDDEVWPGEAEKPPKQCKIQLILKDSALRIWRIA
jgi:diacylglycerol kinase family enzyme